MRHLVVADGPAAEGHPKEGPGNGAEPDAVEQRQAKRAHEALRGRKPVARGGPLPAQRVEREDPAEERIRSQQG